MSFYIDKKFARQHYAKNSLLLFFISIFVFLATFIFYVINPTMLTLTLIIYVLSIFFATISLMRYLLGTYEKLSIDYNTITLTKEEIFVFRDSGRDKYAKTEYNYNNISINNVIIQKRYIIVQGAFEFLVHHEYQGNKNRGIKQIIKIPRIFANEDKIISILNDIKK